MHLLVVILEKATDLEKIITKFREIGVMGATLFDSRGIGRTTLYGTDAPIISSLKRIFEGDAVYNHTMISVIKTEETLNQAIKAVADVCGDMNLPDKGILFTIKLEHVVGFGELHDA